MFFLQNQFLTEECYDLNALRIHTFVTKYLFVESIDQQK